ncbi:MBL fold metallo-hydrolase [Candidatus Zixiibacteriota bacterium]
MANNNFRRASNMAGKTGAALFSLALSGLLLIQCATSQDITVRRQVTGLETNCYLIFDEVSKEAALIDVGGPIDSLLAIINQNQLTVKYFFFTHGHTDHTLGLPAIRNDFPQAKVCMHRQDYENTFIWAAWARDFFGEETLAEWAENPEFRKIMEFDPHSFGEPDIFIEDNQVFDLGGSDIRAIYTPGHSVGSVCYHTGNKLFSGDLLFRRKVGRTDMLGGSSEDIIRSVRKIYNTLADSTIVYPGHYEYTDIGSEKEQNEEVPADTVTSEN